MATQDAGAIDELVRAYFGCYEIQDRVRIEPLVASGFRFSSPDDDHIDRATYFEKCWPINEHTERIDIDALFVTGDEALVRYVLHTKTGKRFRNVEVVRVANGQVVEVEVYFGPKT